MDIGSRAGELLIAGFEGRAPSAEILDLIGRRRLGGVILYAKNCGSALEVLELTNRLQEAARESGAGRPLFIAIDQEQGRVARITEGVTLFPPMGAIAVARDADLVRRVALAVSRELLAVGVNWNLAPVADVLSTPSCPVGDRSFGRDPARVRAMVAAWVRGAEEGGIISCAKHFPGHGGTDDDSHFVSPRIERSERDLRAVDLVPFAGAVEAGVPAVMTTHITFPALDVELPATFSPEILSGLLRRELGFEGVIVSDDLEMAGSVGAFPLAEGAVRAFRAGADLIIVSGMLLPERDLPGLVVGLSEGANRGTIRIDHSLRRVEELKTRYLRDHWHSDEERARSVLRCPDHLSLLAEVKEKIADGSASAGS